jgi:solute:Na+ symporter, SSS family
LIGLGLPLIAALSSAGDVPYGAKRSATADQSTAALATRAWAVLQQAVQVQTGMGKIHAAEVLIAFGGAESMYKYFEGELPAAESVSPYRVGVWRVLARAAPSEVDRTFWIAKIERIFLNPSNPDRPHAIESLCKIGYRTSGQTLDAARNMARETAGSDAILAWWAVEMAGDSNALLKIVTALRSSDPVVRLVAAYVLRSLPAHGKTALAALASAAESEPSTTEAYPFLLDSAVLLNAKPERATVWRAELERLFMAGSPEARLESCQALMPVYLVGDLPRLEPMLESPDSDTRVAAAWTILYVNARP